MPFMFSMPVAVCVAFSCMRFFLSEASHISIEQKVENASSTKTDRVTQLCFTACAVMQFADGFEHFTNSTHPNVLEDPDTGRTFYANVTTGESSRAPNLQECGIQAQCIEMNGMKRVGI